jgi:hypothetical protein
MGEVENVEITTEASVEAVEPTIQTKPVVMQQGITMSGIANTAANALVTAAAGMVLNVVGGALVAGTHKVAQTAGGWIQARKQARKERKALKALQELDAVTDPDEGDTEE